MTDEPDDHDEDARADRPAAGGREDTAEEGRDGTDDGGDEPFGDLAERVGDRPDDGEGGFASEFEDVDADEADPDALWDDLQAGPGTATGDSGDDDVYVVEEREYCRRCQHFSAPPSVSCEYEGSEILSVVDTERFRVRGCPIVRGEADRRDDR